MKKVICLLSALSMLAVFSCQENPSDAGPATPETYFPLSTGNYWVYESSELDANNQPTGTKYTDSIVIAGTEVINGLKAYVAVTYRDGAELERTYYGVEGTTVKLYARAFKPILPADSADCWSKFKYNWKDYVRFGQSMWFTQDSAAGDIYPSLVQEIDSVTGESKYVVVNSETRWYFTVNAELKATENFDFNSRSYRTNMFELKGSRILRLVSPDSIKFVKDPSEEYEYFENNRAMVVNNYNLKIWLSRGIGMVQSIGRLDYGKKLKYNLKRDLLRYRVM